MKSVQPLEHKLAAAADNISLLELLIVLAKYKNRLIVTPVCAAILSAVISLALPDIYKATTKLLPPQQAQSSAAAILSQLGGMGGAAAGMAGIKNPSDLYIGMLKSRTIADKLIATYNLKKVYDTDSFEKARLELEDNTSIISGKDGLITIEVEDKDRKRVAALANSYVSELLQLTRIIAVTEAGQRRLFYERQLEQTKNNLAKVEALLKGSLDARGVISVDVESRAILETVGRLRAQVSAKEIELNSMRAFVTDSNPDYRRVEEELASLRSELSKLENGRNPDAANSDKDAKNQSGIQNIKLLRDVKYYQMLYELLAKQYEMARLDEAKDNSVIQVLDTAVEPERKDKPHRGLIVALSTFAALLGAIFWAFVSDARKRLLSSEGGAAQWNELIAYLKFK